MNSTETWPGAVKWIGRDARRATILIRPRLPEDKRRETDMTAFALPRTSISFHRPASP